MIHNNVSEEFRSAPKPFNHKNPRILQVSTNPNKNIPRLANALTGLSCTLVIIGYLTAKQRRILKKFNIVYENYTNLSRQAMLEQYLSCDLLVFASTYEGFCLPIIEANATGRPVITSNGWSMPEVGVDAACYVDPFDVNSIRNRVLQVISDENFRAKLVQRGFENVKRFRAGVARNFERD